MSDKTFNVLFICTGNSARSILAETILNQLGRGQFKAYSAGSFPAGRVNPYTLEILQRWEMDTSTLRSKSWDEFAAPGAPKMDFVFTVCDQAAGEVCPVWPGQPILAHWGAPDPAKAEGSHEHIIQEFRNVGLLLRKRIELMLALPIAKLEKLAIQHEVEQIGKISS
ncbi:Protein-tyrosine-phosphatase [Limnobacter sp. 130]|uniref:arsenate reductase ArsC n=1 Tax=Limnobacter sp. 130 TaxID=2653147 RepID=UPI0012F2BCD2|nr:arsenate reductase ArsC [Limnobacter sp. 130]VWX34673.1 Protein-tyrosine-phosphatase [Limnobacter sp. 130]